MRRFAFALLAAFTLAACSSDDDDGTGPDPDCTVTAVAITGAPATLAVGQTAQLGTTITQQDCGTLTPTWQSSNATVLSVSATGLLSANVAGGPVTITATAGGKSGTTQITVTQVQNPGPVTQLTLTPDSILLAPVTPLQLLVEAKDAQNIVVPNPTVTWSSNFPVIAAVNGGLITAGAAASITPATITGSIATAGAPITAQTKVWVAQPRLAFLWSNNASVDGLSTPDANYSYTTAGAGVNAVTRTAVGRYTVAFTGIGRAGVETEALFATAYGATAGTYCRIRSWSTAAAEVWCVDATGADVDARFTLTAMGAATFAGRSGFLWADNSAAASYGPDAFYRWSSSNRPMQITRTGAGSYTVRFPGLGRTGTSTREGIIVSAYGTVDATCQSAGWASAGTDLDIQVRCFSAAGAAIDQRFTIAVLSEARENFKLAFADADQPAAVAGYNPTNGAVRPTGTVSVNRTGTGVYTVQFDGFTRTGGAKEIFHVTPVANDARRCVVGGWDPSGAGTLVTVRCSTAAGAPADSRFVVVGVQ